MKNKILFSLLFLFLLSGFLFFNADFVKAENGTCFCTITIDANNKTTTELDTDEENCAEMGSNINYKCEWSSGEEKKAACNCDGEKGGGFSEETTEIGCLLSQEKDGENFTCKWEGNITKTDTTEDSDATPALDLPSVAGLNQLEDTDVKTVLGNIIFVAMGLLGSIALALFAYAGVLWMLSGGNAERSTQAKNIVVWAVLGLFVIFASYTIVSFIFSAVE